jgi:hypothetical protein
MKTRHFSIQKILSGLALVACSVLPASAHFVYDSPAGAAHNLEHLAPTLSLIVLLLALGATTFYCARRK